MRKSHRTLVALALAASLVAPVALALPIAINSASLNGLPGSLPAQVVALVLPVLP